MVIDVNKIPFSKLYKCRDIFKMTWRESRPNLAKHSSYHNVSKILVVQESNVSSELNSDLVVRLCFSVTVTTQEEGHYQPFIICKACVYKKSVKNELKVITTE